MKNQLLSGLFLVFPLLLWSQISGTVTDENNEPLESVNVFIENTYKGTTTNADGFFELNPASDKENYTLVFQYLGYQTHKEKVATNQESVQIQLAPETTSLDDVVVTAGENPANRVIRNAIENRKKNAAKTKSFKADFYSKSIWKVNSVPSNAIIKVQEVEKNVDSTGAGVIYLSETVSTINYQQPNNFKEHIIASRVSGDDQGFSFNNAEDFNISYYNNTIEMNVDLISPIANYAFNYYDYKLDGVFYDENGFLINKVKVIPKRENDRIFSGFIYIVEDTWEIFGTELTTTGKAMNVSPLETLEHKQNFTYDQENEMWVLVSQSLEFDFGLFGITGDGKFLGFYKNHEINPDFENDFFGREIISFEENANKKDSTYWKSNRPIPLTETETKDYKEKDSILEVRSSPEYLDSIDQKNNKFRVFDIVSGYTYQNSVEQRSFEYKGLIDKISYNNVQGWNISSGFRYAKRDPEQPKAKMWLIDSEINYGFSDEKFRGEASFTKMFNNTNRPVFKFSAGLMAEQINNTDPISPFINTVAATFFERSYIKLYDRLFAEALYSQEFFNGFRGFASIGFEERSPLTNATNSRIWVNNGDGFTANNPFAPASFGSESFQKHQIAIAKIGGIFNFGQKYISRPDGKYNIPSSKYPTLSFVYEKGFAADLSDYNFDVLKVRVTQNINLKNLGKFAYSINAGTFFGDESVSAVDLKHFNGNQTYFETASNYLNRFNLMPYYEFSTNQNYTDWHAEHNFNGFILNKIPGIRQLNLNLIAGAKTLVTENRKPYSELSIGVDNIGIGKLRFLRVDYVQPYHNGWRSGGVMFGTDLLDFIN
ncbi:MAG: DUF5686 and carboxypeptidase regulatory-like domain-containing protein [Bacteroidota bacterium]